MLVVIPLLVIQLSRGIDIYAVSKLLGHSELNNRDLR